MSNELKTINSSYKYALTLNKHYKKVIIADDDRVVRTLLAHQLKKAGFDVITLGNGKEVIEQISDDIGVVLLDLNMPEMDGITCIRKLREKFEDLSPIMITASDDISDAIEAMKYGAFDYLIKPVKPKKLIALVEKVLQNWIQAQRLREVEAALEKAREREINIASKIQQNLLMGQPPENMQGINIASLTIPSQKVDGDFFDFFKINNKTLDIVVGDVMGKGVASALLGAAIKSHFLRALNELILENTIFPEPCDIVSRVHAGMINQMEEIETFVTLCYARINLNKFTISFVDCGHMRTIHYHKDSNSITLMEGINVPLGLPETEPFKQISISFNPGDFFFFYSDGITEAQNPYKELYGEKRLSDFILKNADNNPENIIKNVFNEIIRFSQSKSFDDDFTCVVVSIEKTVY